MDSMYMNLNKLWEMEDREAWCASVHGVTTCQTWFSDWATITTYICIHQLVKNPPVIQETQVQFLEGKIHWRSKWWPTEEPGAWGCRVHGVAESQTWLSSWKTIQILPISPEDKSSLVDDQCPRVWELEASWWNFQSRLHLLLGLYRTEY